MNNTYKQKNSADQVKILWIEDDVYMGGLIKTRLQNEGYEVVYVKTGEEALQEIKDPIHPNIILADILLPGVDGFSVLEAVKSDKELKHIPVVLFSNLDQDSDIKKGMKLGAEVFLTKSSTSPGQVVEMINSILNKDNQ